MILHKKKSTEYNNNTRDQLIYICIFVSTNKFYKINTCNKVLSFKTEKFTENENINH